MTHSYAWHDTQVQCDMIHSYVWLGSHLRVPWLIHMRDMTHRCSVIWFIHTCDLAHIYVCHDSFICVTWLTGTVWYDSFIRVTWLSLTCDLTHSYAWHDWQVQRIPFHDHSAPALRYNYVTQIAKETYIQTFKETNKTGQLTWLLIHKQTFILLKWKMYFYIKQTFKKNVCWKKGVCYIFVSHLKRKETSKDKRPVWLYHSPHAWRMCQKRLCIYMKRDLCIYMKKDQ